MTKLVPEEVIKKQAISIRVSLYIVVGEVRDKNEPRGSRNCYWCFIRWPGAVSGEPDWSQVALDFHFEVPVLSCVSCKIYKR
jgi:hypothetical protein